MKRFSQGGSSPCPKHLLVASSDSDEYDDFQVPNFSSSPPSNLDFHGLNISSSPPSNLGLIFSQGSSNQSQPWMNYDELPFSGVSAPGSDSLESESILGKSSKLD